MSRIGHMPLVKMHIGIIGGGFTGCLLAVQLLRRAAANPGDVLSLTLIESAGVLGRGAAYGTDNPNHLLNVRAANMGAFADDPGHFHAWLTARDGAQAPPPTAFVSRALYGQYVTDTFNRTVSEIKNAASVEIVTGLATALHAGPRPAVDLADGRRFAFDRLALCFGNLPAGTPPGLSAEARASGHFLQDSWRARELAAIPPADPILIVGSGLTMADVVQSLHRQGHKGRIDVVSRHGLVPRRHAAARPLKAESPQGSLRDIVRAVRTRISEAVAQGHDWRDVIDSLRPATQEIWRGFSPADRGRFLRHIRAYWEVHRHRIAPELADEMDTLTDAGQLRVAAGRIGAIAWRDGKFDVEVRYRGALTTARLAPVWIVNCTGPQGDYGKTSNPLVAAAVRDGVIRPDALHLSLDVTEEGAIVDAAGRVSPNIVAVGPPTRSAFWEITSVPDIRGACARGAETLLRPAQ